MNNNNLISIITPLYNAEKYLAETIKSVQAQTYQHWEMIFVDDGSTDNSYNIVAEYATKDNRIIIYKRNRLPKGASTSRNIGIEKSKGDYIIFLDADDLLFPHCLENRVDVFQTNGNLDFAVFQMSMLSRDEEFNGRLLTLPSQNYLCDFIASKFPWTVTSPMWTVDFLKNKLKGFDESFIRLEDPEMHLRALMTKGVKYQVYTDKEYLDCSYRFFKNKINLTSALTAYKQYLNSVCKLIKQQSDTIDTNALKDLYDQIVLFYSAYSVSDLKQNISLMKDLNRTFLSKNIINKKLYRKTCLFLYYIKYNLYKSSIANKILLKSGFDHFYAFRIPNNSSDK